MKRVPGHLKERNHFDGKDMILLVVTILIIYGAFYWFFGPGGTYDPNTYQNQEVTSESSSQQNSQPSAD